MCVRVRDRQCVCDGVPSVRDKENVWVCAGCACSLGVLLAFKCLFVCLPDQDVPLYSIILETKVGRKVCVCECFCRGRHSIVF